MAMIALSVFAAALMMMIGGLVYVKLNDHFPEVISQVTGVSAGFLLVLIFFGIIPEAKEALEGQLNWILPLCVAFGAFFIMIFEKCLPVQHHHDLSEEEAHHHDHSHLFLITLLAFGLHSIFEMLSIFIAGASEPTTGLILALVIGIHNIPIGFIIMAQLEATGEKRKKIWLGMLILAFAEVVVSGLIFLLISQVITPELQGGLLAVTGGIMLYLLFDELLPKIYQDMDQHKANYSILIGAVLMLFFLVLFVE